MKTVSVRGLACMVFSLLAIVSFLNNEEDIGWYCLIIANIWGCSITLKSIDD